MFRRLIFLVAAAVMLVLGIAGVASAATFPDLTPGVLSGYGLTEGEVLAMSQGYDDGLWRPFNPLPRQQFTKMAVDNFDIPGANPDAPTFTDVPKSDYYYQFIEGATAAGLVEGIGGGLFAPQRVITREEAAAVLVRWLAEANDLSPDDLSADEVDEALAPFADGGSVSTELRAEVALAVEFGILQGSGGRLFPQRDLTRIEGAALLVRSAKVSIGAYEVYPLVSDQQGMAPAVDADLVNGWGLAAGPTTFWWVADNGTDKSTLYDGDGQRQSLVVDVPAAPTGIVYNGGAAFIVSSGGASGAARFLFATEEGKILGWNPAVPAPTSTSAFVVVDRSAANAVYKGLAIGSVGTAPYLYATDFVNGRIDVFDGDLLLQTWTGKFVDPLLPSGYAPFGIQAIGDKLFVTYAKQQTGSTDEQAGQGFGFVDEFTMSGDFVARVASQGVLNAPWGLAMAPATEFGRFSGCLLVSNFGDGTIHAYAQNPSGVWTPRGALREADGELLAIDGLWGIAFGQGEGTSSGPADWLYFAAGPDDESHGLFGFVQLEELAQ